MQETPDVELLGPPPFKWVTSVIIWLATVVALSQVWFGHRGVGIGTPGYVGLNLWGGSAMIIAIAIAAQIAQFVGRDIVLSVEGVRKGKGQRSIFIPWHGASFYYDLKKHRHVLAAKGATIKFTFKNFSDPRRFREIVGHIKLVVRERGLQRNAQAPKTSAPLHRLSTADRAAFLAYRGDAFFNSVFWRYLAALTFIISLFYCGFISLLVFLPRLPPLAREVADGIRHTFPFLSHGLTAAVLVRVMPVTFVVSCATLLDGAKDKHIRAIRMTWLEQFDCSQVIAISEFGLSCQSTGGPIFVPWSDILKISRTRELILFQVTSSLTDSIVLPRRIFTTAAAATAFYRQAIALRTTALAKPTLIDPVSFWEIA